MRNIPRYCRHARHLRARYEPRTVDDFGAGRAFGNSRDPSFLFRLVAYGLGQFVSEPPITPARSELRASTRERHPRRADAARQSLHRGPSVRPGYEQRTPVLPLWTGVAWLALGAKDIAVEIGHPLPSVRRDVEVAHGALDMRRYAAPIKLRI
jgi:hypothetical protein